MGYKNRDVLVAAGHGGSDPGAVAAGKFKESIMALVVAKACVAELKKYTWINARSARTNDINQSINTKCNMANNMGADLALDIHWNAGGGDGAEVWHSIAGGDGKLLAENILKEFKKIGQNSRGCKTKEEGGADYFGFIRLTKMPAVIVECGFIDNAKDRKLFDTPAELKKMGVAIAQAIITTLVQMNNKNGVQAKPGANKPNKKPAAKPAAKKAYTGTLPKLPKKGYFDKGDRGAQVKYLQQFLNWAIGTELDADGILGNATKSAVKKYQEKYNLEPDGLFWKRLPCKG